MGIEYVTCGGLFKAVETDKSFGVSYEYGGDVCAWLAKSQVEHEDLSYHKPGEVQIPKWLADREELEYDA